MPRNRNGSKQKWYSSGFFWCFCSVHSSTPSPVNSGHSKKSISRRKKKKKHLGKVLPLCDTNCRSSRFASGPAEFRNLCGMTSFPSQVGNVCRRMQIADVSRISRVYFEMIATLQCLACRKKKKVCENCCRYWTAGLHLFSSNHVSKPRKVTVSEKRKSAWMQVLQKWPHLIKVGKSGILHTSGAKWLCCEIVPAYVNRALELVGCIKLLNRQCDCVILLLLFASWICSTSGRVCGCVCVRARVCKWVRATGGRRNKSEDNGIMIDRTSAPLKLNIKRYASLEKFNIE